jgi:hypothetical protein
MLVGSLVSTVLRIKFFISTCNVAKLMCFGCSRVLGCFLTHSEYYAFITTQIYFTSHNLSSFYIQK